MWFIILFSEDNSTISAERVKLWIHLLNEICNQKLEFLISGNSWKLFVILLLDEILVKQSSRFHSISTFIIAISLFIPKSLFCFVEFDLIVSHCDLWNKSNSKSNDYRNSLEFFSCLISALSSFWCPMTGKLAFDKRSRKRKL